MSNFLYDIDIVDIIEGAINTGQGRVFTQMPGKITSYEPTTQTCSVQPMVKIPIFDPETGEPGESEMLPELSNVPVGFIRGGGFSIVFDLQAGDEVTIEWDMYSRGQWRATGEVSEPLDIRKHIASCIVRPDAGSLAKTLLSPTFFPGMLAIGKDGDPTSTIRIAQGQVICGGLVPLPLAMALQTVQAITALQAQVTTLNALVAVLLTPATGLGLTPAVFPSDSGAAFATSAGAVATAAALNAPAVVAALPLIPSTITQGE
jgi:hypothetical protein